MPPGSPSKKADDNRRQAFQGPHEFICIVRQEANTNYFIGSSQFKRAHLLGKEIPQKWRFGGKTQCKENRSNNKFTYWVDIFDPSDGLITRSSTEFIEKIEWNWANRIYLALEQAKFSLRVIKQEWISYVMCEVQSTTQGQRLSYLQ